MTRSSVFLFAGELSGDLHGEKLIQAIRLKHPQTDIFGVGGPRMRAAGLKCLIESEKFEVMGFVDVFFALPRLFKLFYKLKKQILNKSPDIVLFIDYPGFSFTLARALKRNRFKGKICHYICPSVWAWGKKRIPMMEKTLDHLFTIFPFETELFDAKKLNCHYVGHPLKASFGFDPTPPLDIDLKYRVVGIFPGSRTKELYRNFPDQLKVAINLLEKHKDLFFAVSIAHPQFSLIIDQMLKECPQFPKDRILFVHRAQNNALMKRLHLAIAKSGTNNLELALHKVPTIVTYGIGPLDLFIAKTLLKIDLPYYCIVNILANTQVFPELIGPNLSQKNLYQQADRLLSSSEEWNKCRNQCEEIDKMLENKSPEREITSLLFNEK